MSRDLARETVLTSRLLGGIKYPELNLTSPTIVKRTFLRAALFTLPPSPPPHSIASPTRMDPAMQIATSVGISIVQTMLSSNSVYGKMTKVSRL